MVLDLVDGIARVIALVTGVGISVNVLDDLFVDAHYFAGRLGRRKSRVIAEQVLRGVEPKRVAMVIPAWKEAEVIEQMLEHNLAGIDYPRDRYDVFCGTYQNDADTQARVDAVARRFPSVHKVVVPHDGPTSKADCLNWVYQGIILAEQRSGRRFDILLMHDAEDVVHPLSLRLYSLLIPANDFVQTPVFSLPLPKARFVSGTYIDEFAEHHLKDMLVREAIGGLVPSAGVGSAFARDAFEQIAVAHGQEPFNVESLTEDYEIGLKFRLAGRKAHFACHTVERREGTKVREEFIATREYFPAGFNASIRQRSRWILGISLQTWSQVGWQGGLPVLYCLWRDRKTVLTNALLLTAYLLLLYVGVRTLIAHATGGTWTIARIVPARSALALILAFNLVAAGWRAGVKAQLVGRLYGPAHALLTVPRLLLGTLIGVVATMRAVEQYVAHRFAGRPLRWLKTTHAFPTLERLNSTYAQPSEYLLEQRLSSAELEEARALQRATGTRLEEVLTIAGLATASVITKALARQLDVQIADPDPEAVPMALLARLPESLAEALDVLPLEERDGAFVVASASPREEGVREQLQTALGGPVRDASGVFHGAATRARAGLSAAVPRRRWTGARTAARCATAARRRRPRRRSPSRHRVLRVPRCAAPPGRSRDSPARALRGAAPRRRPRDDRGRARRECIVRDRRNAVRPSCVARRHLRSHPGRGRRVGTFRFGRGRTGGAQARAWRPCRPRARGERGARSRTFTLGAR